MSHSTAKLRHHEHTDQSEHPFSEFVRILGKGKKGARSLTQDEAYKAMSMILVDEVLPVQLGAFLMLMRMKEETPDELVGFVRAVQDSLQFSPNDVKVDLDWSSYAGKRRHLPWFLLSVLLLTQQGITVFMHGATGPSPERLYTERALSYLGIQPAMSLEQAKQQLRELNFSYLPLACICPKLAEIINLRPVLGLRSPVHTLVRMINPFAAPYSIQGIFHPSYRPVHQQAALLLDQPYVAVLKGEGGETERNPDMNCLVQSVHLGEMQDETWPPLFRLRHIKPEQLDPAHLLAVWQGKVQDEFAEASVIGTAAVALKLLGKAATQDEAQELAMEYWQARRV